MKLISLIVFCFLLKVTLAQNGSTAKPSACDSTLIKRFEEWKAKYGITYSTPEEEAKRREIFCQNARRVRATSVNATYTTGDNAHSDKTTEERNNNMLGARPPSQATSNAPESSTVRSPNRVQNAVQTSSTKKPQNGSTTKKTTTKATTSKKTTPKKTTTKKITVRNSKMTTKLSTKSVANTVKPTTFKWTTTAKPTTRTIAQSTVSTSTTRPLSTIVTTLSSSTKAPVTTLSSSTTSASTSSTSASTSSSSASTSTSSASTSSTSASTSSISASTSSTDVPVTSTTTLVTTARQLEIVQNTVSSGEAIPASLNYTGDCTPAKDQYGCGSCWAFSAVAIVEYWQKRNQRPNTIFSEQDILDCNAYGDNCGGGWAGGALDYIKNPGVADGISYPYTTQQGQCLNPSVHPPYLKIANYCEEDLYGNETRLMEIVKSYGPTSVVMFVQNVLYSYKTGIFYEPTCPSDVYNHAVTVVGYGTDETASDPKDYWIIKNSWGPSWGQNGYGWFARNKNNHCAIASWASYLC